MLQKCAFLEDQHKAVLRNSLDPDTMNRYGSETQVTVRCFTWGVNSRRRKNYFFKYFLHRVGKLWYTYKLYREYLHEIKINFEILQ